jgi:hypothetical protein
MSLDYLRRTDRDPGPAPAFRCARRIVVLVPGLTQELITVEFLARLLCKVQCEVGCLIRLAAPERVKGHRADQLGVVRVGVKAGDPALASGLAVPEAIDQCAEKIEILGHHRRSASEAGIEVTRACITSQADRCAG